MATTFFHSKRALKDFLAAPRAPAALVHARPSSVEACVYTQRHLKNRSDSLTYFLLAGAGWSVKISHFPSLTRATPLGLTGPDGE